MSFWTPLVGREPVAATSTRFAAGCPRKSMRCAEQRTAVRTVEQCLRFGPGRYGTG